MKHRLAHLGLAVIAVLLSSQAASAATFTVNTTADAPDLELKDQVCNAGEGRCTLRAAVQQAAAISGTDAIDIPTAGTYALTLGQISIVTPVTVTGAGARGVIIDAGGADRAFNVAAGSGTVSISGVTLRNGRADDSNGFYGGVVFNRGNLTLDHVTVTGGHAGSGGGIANSGGILTLMRSTVSGNAADVGGGDGGGILNHGFSDIDLGNVPGVISMRNSTISGNSARLGGGIISRTDERDVGNSISIQDSTIAGNASGDRGGAGGILIDPATGGTASFARSIVAGNTGAPPNCSGDITSSGFNLESGTDCGFIASTDLQSTNPRLGSLRNNGGQTNTRRPANGSRAIDAAGTRCVLNDQRGVPRPQGLGCDIGAVEVVPPKLTLSPLNSQRAAGLTQTITALVENTDGGSPSGSIVRYEVTEANPTSGTVTTAADGTAAITWTGVNPGTDTLEAFVDLNDDGMRQSSEPQTAATVDWVSLTLTPTSAARTTGQSHTVTAQIERGGAPSASPVRYRVDGANLKNWTAAQPDSTGKALLTWTGDAAGTDTLTAFVDLNGDQARQTAEPQQQATVTWNDPPPEPPPATLGLSPGTANLVVGSSHTVVAQAQNGAGPVRFFVNGANPISGVTSTDGAGRASFSYPGNNAGDDSIFAYLDLNSNGVQNSDEPGATVSATWTAQQQGPQEEPLFPPGTPTGRRISDLPPPETGETVNIGRVSGTVLVRFPEPEGDARTSQAQAHKQFVPLDGSAQIPVGSEVDTGKGVLRLQSGSNSTGSKTQTATFFLGRFELRQKRTRRPVTEMVLKGGTYRGCPRAGTRSSTGEADTSARRRTSRSRVRRLWGSGKGRYRTRGRYSSATVRGTKWLVEDRCGGTLTRLPRRPRTSRVDVRDFNLRKTIRLRAGQSYLAKAPAPRSRRR